MVDDSCFAINAGQNAAFEEIEAEMRKLRKKQDDEEFLSKIKRGVNRRVFIENKLEKRNNNFHVSFDIVLL